jgi:hypothetical protein
MQPQELEHQTEAFLSRLVPGLAAQWKGVSEPEIDKIERLAGRSLPPFYRWFLARMGLDMGPLKYPTVDFSAARILSCYEEGIAIPQDPRFFLIGYESDEAMSLHVFYDFDHPSDDDARVVRMDPAGGPFHIQFDTFREMLVWGEVYNSRILKAPQSCFGSIKGDSGFVVSSLNPVMAKIGFVKPIETGINCAIYDRQDAAMSVRATPRDPPEPLHFFYLSASDAGAIRRILGAVAHESHLEVKIREWTPRLPDPFAMP